MEELIVTDEFTKALAAPESPVREELKAVLEEAVVTLQKLTLHQIHQSRKNLKLF